MTFRLGVTLALAAIAAGTAATGAGAQWTPVHGYRGAVPVISYHGLHVVTDSRRDPYSISPGEFAKHMEMLAASGFHAISIAQYARFAAGDVAALPDQPILITFDDGRGDSYLAADPVLARFGMRATMFVITANAARPRPGYLGWSQLVAMSSNGRWDVQEHAHAGHVLIPSGPRSQTGPYYANLLYRNGSRETFTDFKRRVSGDILTGRRLLAARIPGFQPLGFALPYGSYGQERTNYAPIAGWERGWLTRTFAVLFVQDRRVYNLPGNPIGQRYGIHSYTTASTLHDWLMRALPRSAWTTPPPPPRSRPRRPRLRKARIGRRSASLTFRLVARTTLRVTRRRAGRRRSVAVPVRSNRRVRDRRLRPHTLYVYRAVAVDRAGTTSRPLRLRVRTRR